DMLAAGNDVELRQEALQSSIEATIPTVLNVYDDWDEILTFNDGTGPDPVTWPKHSDTGHGTPLQSAADDGAWSVIDIDPSDLRNQNYKYRRNVPDMGEDFTLQAEVKTSSSVNGNVVHPYTAVN